jgi:hypothetical protein
MLFGAQKGQQMDYVELNGGCSQDEGQNDRILAKIWAILRSK